MKKFEWGEEHTVVIETISNAVANISKVHQYDAKRNIRVKCDAGHSGLGAPLEQQTDDGTWAPIWLASRVLNVQEKKYSTSELEFLAVVWAVDRYKY